MSLRAGGRPVLAGAEDLGFVRAVEQHDAAGVAGQFAGLGAVDQEQGVGRVGIPGAGGDQDRLARRRTIAAGIERLRAAAPEKYSELLLRLRRYDRRLRRFGLRDRHLDWRITARDAAIFAVRELAIAVVLAPVCLAGIVVFFVPYQLTGIAARLSTRERDQLATAQVISGAAIYAAWIAGLTVIAWRQAGTAAALTPLLLLTLAVIALVALERESSVLAAIRSWLVLQRAHHDTRERLRRRRSELADVLDQVHQWLEAGVPSRPVA